MVFDYMKNRLGYMPESDRLHLKSIEKLNDCRFTLDDLDGFIKDFDFFKDNEKHLLFVQDGRCIPFCNVNPEKIFYGIVKDVEGFKILTGKDFSDFICPREGVRLVPIWVYQPNR